MTLPFLLEVGVEEIPDWMLQPAMDHLKEKIAETIAGLGGRVTMAEATPRRMAIMADGIAEREADQAQVVKGPPVSASAQAVEGFARKQGVAAADMRQADGYWQIDKVIAGRAASDILSSRLPQLILGIPWPKTMLWPGKGGARFIRPIRWMVCLLGDHVLAFEINGVATGNRTDGHRQTGRKGVEVTIANYEKTLLKNGVILRAEDRREKLIKEVGQDTPLIELHVYLNEHPAALLGSFDPSYLSLPDEVLETVMRHHQKYFAVRNGDGALLPEFIAVMNRPDDPDGLIRRGHERVLRARFNDARFFYDVDQKKPLKDRLEDLKHVAFQQQLGSYSDKAQRMVSICADELGAGPAACRAALLAKTDLTTEMVKEFTELQGIIGGRYAKVQGESEDAAKAIYDHYRPVSMEDAIPESIAGQQVALADKVDTLREFFRIGLIPSGSKDPFALRRAAQGVIRILVEGQVNWAIPAIAPQAELRSFLEDRIRYYFRDVQGFRYDEVNAVMAAGFDEVKDVASRLEAVQSVRASENFEPLAASFKRIKNILKQAGVETPGNIDDSLLEAGPERELFAAQLSLNLTGDYARDLAAIAGLRPAVDAFFDKVMVNAPDPVVRGNRLNLLAALYRASSSIADFSEIVSAGA